MKASHVILLMLIPVFAIAARADSKAHDAAGALLQARIELALLQTRYLDKHPNVIQAKARIEALTKVAPSLSPEEYAVRIQEQIEQLTIDEINLSQRYLEKHPRRLEVSRRLAFLEQELERFGRPPAKESAPDKSGQITVNVLGAVNKPSRFTLPQGSTVLDALASAGGVARSGKVSKLRIIHRTAGEKSQVTIVDVEQVLNGTIKDVVLRDADTLYIPDREL